ncbi:threonine/serine exporter family protein [Corynebacterium sp.]|uniref:threonine/serine exporter family protein n=1 Tax=Corynebacterium sp. TaxID=1720 RepID=UPI0025C5E6C5|nr:threonine/serine exporter family protein [Corynebacterium sp.]
MDDNRPGSGRLRGAKEIRDCLGVLADLACGFLESGQPGWRVGETLTACADARGLTGFGFTTVGRLVIVEASLPDGGTVTVTTSAKALDLIDCTRSWRLHRLAEEIASPTGHGAGHGAVPGDIGALRTEVARLRSISTPWWAVAGGTTMLAFVISMQLGVGWQSWVAAAVVQMLTAFCGQALTVLKLPELFAAVVKSAVAGTLATVLVLVDVLDPVAAAAAIAVNWLLLVPLPQIIGAMSDVIDGDYLSAVTRAGSVVVTAFGITISGIYVFALGEVLDMDHPLIGEVPGLPWYLALVFSALGALANAFANGGWLRLAFPAMTVGVVTGVVNQFLLVVVGASAVWAAAGASTVLGAVAVLMAVRTGYPDQVFTLMGVTGALLPGIAVVTGILQVKGGESGAEHFPAAVTTCVRIGTGVAVGADLTTRWRALWSTGATGSTGSTRSPGRWGAGREGPVSG